MEEKNRPEHSIIEEAAALAGRYLRGEASAVEREALDGWAPKEEGMPLSVGERWQAGRCERLVWRRLVAGLGLEARRGRRWRVVARRVAGVAAVLALAAGMGWWLAAGDAGRGFAGRQPVQLVCAAGEQPAGADTLADGSLVALNRGTVLSVGRGFGGRERRVKLEGQAYFAVSRDTARPFVIEAGGMAVRVLGTSFEVTAYGEVPEQTVAVRTGRVEVSDARTGKRLAVLTAGMRLAYNPETGSLAVGEADADEVAAWREGRLVFRDASVAEVKLRLRQYFGKLLVAEPGVLDEGLRMTSSFSYDEITAANVMDRFCALSGTRWRMEGSVIRLTMNDE